MLVLTFQGSCDDHMGSCIWKAFSRQHSMGWVVAVFEEFLCRLNKTFQLLCFYWFISVKWFSVIWVEPPTQKNPFIFRIELGTAK